MRTTLNLPEKLIEEALAATQMKTKTAVIIHALENLVQAEKLQAIKKYKGKVKLDIDINELRAR